MKKEIDVIDILNNSEVATKIIREFEKAIDRQGIDRNSDEYRKSRETTIMLRVKAEPKAMKALAHNMYHYYRGELIES